ncbi:GH92 family glycosyl hydrolase [Algoriphagus halophytocola]|uniref:GH92 family glycosyl hydrolase n=1 Tax=Algoriphagus halophytocola TaxID=2991499 RepID=A0ABY6MLZ0_9BACT|nr:MULTISPECIES: GH92 family glycosyl hydrolase [unclassified Algoriphagus]UZD23999.1 GH92 family glycosyl hydrolase [Algoriphagus sp. TR-M5]WBL41371.1 GH92 family glycosyl hydrolase [Algoriphagus sp. TR-M9]
MNLRICLTFLILPFSFLALSQTDADPASLVNPYVDSKNSRWFFFNSATRPFGMVNLSPDTDMGGAWGSGYRYESDSIKGLSHVHAWQLSALSVLPVSEFTLGTERNFGSPFSHETEIVQPGYHRLWLDRYTIKVELTSTLRTGFHRYTFPRNASKQVLIRIGGLLGPSQITDGELIQLDSKTLQGHVINGPTVRRPYNTPVFFAIKLNQNISDINGWGAEGLSKKLSNIHGEDSGVLLGVDGGKQELLMKVGISYVSEAQAMLNLNSELPHWDFDQVVKESTEEWNSYLGRIEVKGATEKDRRRFYTDLFHALQGRRTISDVNGKYADLTSGTHQVKQIPLDEAGNPKFRHFNSDSFWGAQWTINTLWHLVYPEITEEFVNSMLRYYQDGGLIPRGPSGGNYTYVMTGASSTPFIVSAYQKGIRGFDVDLAYEGLKKNHRAGGIMEKAGYEHKTALGGGFSYYLKNGFVPWPIPEGNFGYHQDGPSLTLEYAYQDWTLAQLAKALGDKSAEQEFLQRSKNYQNTYDKESSWMRPRHVDGSWKTPFDPYEYNAGFNEANGSQGTWFVPHDLEGLAELMGGTEKAIERLNQSFVESEKLGFTSGTSHAQETHPEYRRIPINYGNQPSIQTSFIFHKLGKPALTQYWSRAIVNRIYSGLSHENGYNGDEDQGLMGSLAVLMKIGLFQMNGGTEADPAYQIGSPIFDQVSIKLNPKYYPGKEFIIKTLGNSPEHVYIKRANWKSQPLPALDLRHSQIIHGGELLLEMSNQAN